MGKSVGRNSSLAVGVYSFVLAVGFMGAFGGIKAIEESYDVDWRILWRCIGLFVLIYGVCGTLLLGKDREPTLEQSDHRSEEKSFTLTQALATPMFWVFALATSFYGMIAAGISLFNQSILEERL